MCIRPQLLLLRIAFVFTSMVGKLLVKCIILLKESRGLTIRLKASQVPRVFKFMCEITTEFTSSAQASSFILRGGLCSVVTRTQVGMMMMMMIMNNFTLGITLTLLPTLKTAVIYLVVLKLGIGLSSGNTNWSALFHEGWSLFRLFCGLVDVFDPGFCVLFGITLLCALPLLF